jgi:hypothetical protein
MDECTRWQRRARIVHECMCSKELGPPVESISLLELNRLHASVNSDLHCVFRDS